MASARKFPLLQGAVHISLVEKIAEPFLETRLGCAADEGMNVCRAQVSVSAEEFEYFNVTRSEFDPLADSRSAHS
jgi:hypothetical protein